MIKSQKRDHEHARGKETQLKNKAKDRRIQSSWVLEVERLSRAQLLKDSGALRNRKGLLSYWAQ